MRLLFLDIDGVLNSSAWASKHGHGWNRRFDPQALERLQRVVDATGCHIVVSSSWRIGKTLATMKEEFRFCGMPDRLLARVMDTTPYLRFESPIDSYCRGDEIQHWMDSSGLFDEPKVSIAIVDDDNDMGAYMSVLVQTSWANGLQDEHVERLIGLLQRDLTAPANSATIANS